MTDFNRYLTDDIAKIAKEVHPYTEGAEHGMFVVHPTIVLMAFEQIIENNGIDIGDSFKTIYQEIFLHHKQGKTLKGKTLVDVANEKDFKWPLYDKCAEFCKRENIEYVGNGGAYYHEEKVEKPQTMAQAVAWFTVAEMKDYLREYGQKVSGKRTDIEQRMIEHVLLDDLHIDLLTKYEDKVKGTHYGYLCNKYELLARFVMFRAFYLRDLGKSYYQYKIVPMKGNNERISDAERALAEEVSEGGYDTVFVDGKLAKLLPLFPSSSFYITTDALNTPQVVKTKSKPSFIKRLVSAFTK